MISFDYSYDQIILNIDENIAGQKGYLGLSDPASIASDPFN